MFQNPVKVDRMKVAFNFGKKKTVKEFCRKTLTVRLPADQSKANIMDGTLNSGTMG